MQLEVGGEMKAGMADGIHLRTLMGISGLALGWVGDGYDGVHVFSPEGKRNEVRFCFRKFAVMSVLEEQKETVSL